jgi:ASC-1-like (ASCH) protein
MKKPWGLIPKILDGRKKIESRWYMHKCRPWDKIGRGDVVYFKNSGEPVQVKAEVSKVLQFSDLNPKKVKEILQKFGKEDGLDKKDIPHYFKLFKSKKYCLLIFLKNPAPIRHFEIDKSVTN